MSTTTIVLIVAAVAVVAAIAYFVLRGRGDAVAVATTDANEDPALSATGEAMIVGDVMPIDSGEPVVPPGAAEPPVRDATQRAEIRWTKRFDPREGALDDATRLNLLRDLGIVRAPWGVPLLTQAYEEEPAAEHRRAALRALAAYRHPDTQSTFELVLHEDADEESRAIAANALGALQIRAALPS